MGICCPHSLGYFCSQIQSNHLHDEPLVKEHASEFVCLCVRARVHIRGQRLAQFSPSHFIKARFLSLHLACCWSLLCLLSASRRFSFLHLPSHQQCSRIAEVLRGFSFLCRVWEAWTWLLRLKRWALYPLRHLSPAPEFIFSGTLHLVLRESIICSQVTCSTPVEVTDTLSQWVGLH